MRYLPPLLLLAACTPIDTGFRKPSADDTADTGDDDTDVDPVDTADTDGDLDDDGYTPEEGDCDDTDFRVSPALPEQDEDGKDNDCDGRTDEEWAGFSVGWVDDDLAGHIVRVDTLGREDDVIDLDDGCYPLWLDHFGDGYVVNADYVTVATVAPDGTCTPVGDFSDAEVYAYGLWGVAANVDGTVLAVTIGALSSVATDGTITPLAEWVVDFENPPAHEFAASSVAVDPATGAVGLFDYFGGFATYTAGDGFVVHKRGDFEAPALYTTSGAHRDGGGWYTMGVDATTGGYGIYRWDDVATDWVLEEAWDAGSDWSPQQVAIDGDSGDWYVTANVDGIFPTVYRIVENTGYAADFYRRTEDYAGYFYGIATDYTYGE